MRANVTTVLFDDCYILMCDRCRYYFFDFMKKVAKASILGFKMRKTIAERVFWYKNKLKIIIFVAFLYTSKRFTLRRKGF